MYYIDFIIKVNKEEKIEDIYYLNPQFKDIIDFNNTKKKFYNFICKEDSFFELNENFGILSIENKFYGVQNYKLKNYYYLFIGKNLFKLLLLEKALSNLNEGIQIYDSRGYFLHSNKQSEKLENYQKEEFEGKHLLELYKLDENFSTILEVLKTKKAVLNRCDRFKNANGKELITINNGYPITYKNNLIGASVFESDVTSVKKMNDRINYLNTYLNNISDSKKNDLYCFEDIIHTSDKMKQLINFSKKVSKNNSNVLLTGETGTGKELFAQSIHNNSNRKNEAFIDVNCSAIPSNLIESLFFGTEKGAFTGSENTKGFFEMADGGTLFLDEVNSISLEMQTKLLRVLQEKRFRKVGGKEYKKCDIRLISASNEDLKVLIKKKRLRNDFYYRISVIEIRIPRLIERKEDILILAKYFNNQIGKEFDRKLNLTNQLNQAMLSYEWPGNIRELKHAIEYAYNKVDNQDKNIYPEHFPRHIFTKLPVEKLSQSIDTLKEDQKLDLNEYLIIKEKEFLIKTLKNNNWNITKSAKSIGLSRQNLQYRIKKYDLKSRKQ